MSLAKGISRNILLAIIACSLNACATTDHAGDVADQERLRYDPAIEEYVNFLKSHDEHPVDYVMRLFETKDVVILCERHHAEITQYDIILEILKDKRFRRSVGHVFTELGTSTIRPLVDDLLISNGLSDEQAEIKLRRIFQNYCRAGLWEKHNSYTFMRQVYEINQILPLEEKIRIYPSDVPISWMGMTKEKYREFYKWLLRNRESTMTRQIIDSFEQIKESSEKRKKILVIMNYRHAFNAINFTDRGSSDGPKGDNVGRYLFERYPNQVANVLINTTVPIIGADNSVDEVSDAPAQDGKWDAAFYVIGNRPTGFDFKGSPFGKDSFDLYTTRTHNSKYEDVFTGYLFYKPLVEHRCEWGMPEVFEDPDFEDELYSRYKIIGVEPDRAADAIASLKSIEVEDFEEVRPTLHYINKWLLR